VCLEDLYDFVDSALLARKFSGKINVLGSLPRDITEQLLECVLKCEGLPIKHYEIARQARIDLG
jgi:hypothetical protein